MARGGGGSGLPVSSNEGLTRIPHGTAGIWGSLRDNYNGHDTDTK